MSLSIPEFDLQWMTPWTPSCNTNYWLHSMPFRVGLHVAYSEIRKCKPDDFRVELWTNIYHKNNSEGEWHSVPMEYSKVQQRHDDMSVVYLYEVDLMLTGLGFYSFTFRTRHKLELEYKWADLPSTDGHVLIRLPVKEQTVWIQEPVSAKITHNIYLGNFTAAMQAPDDGFDCLLNMADDAHVFPFQFSRPIIFKKYLVPFGVDHVICKNIVREAVAWLRIMSDRCGKVMVCSRTGHARSGSILIAFIFFMNPDLSFEEAYAFVNKKTLVYPHKGLKRIVHELYPR